MSVYSPLSAPPPLEIEPWRQELRDSYKSVKDLLAHQLITPTEADQLSSLGEQFKVRVTPYYSKLIKNSLDCPIRKQAFPHLEEATPALPDWAIQCSQEIYGRPAPWLADAIGDVRNLAAPRLTHRYLNRAILHLSSSCAVYCRFCFRKAHLNSHEDALYEGSLEPAFQYLEQHTDIHELILTGGDLLSVSDLAVKRLFEKLTTIKHLRVVRLHTRMAVTLPSRFTSSLLKVLGGDWNFQVCLVSHFNHPKEITPEAKASLKHLRLSGVTRLNQSVLLKGVNDTSDCLAALFQGLYELGVIPFYLHHPDWTPGTFHFRVSIEHGKELMSQLRGKVAGPALPQYTLDIPEGYGKISLLDPAHRKVKDLGDFQKGSISGAIYELSPPNNRTGIRAPRLYLDLW